MLRQVTKVSRLLVKLLPQLLIKRFTDFLSPDDSVVFHEVHDLKIDVFFCLIIARVYMLGEHIWWSQSYTNTKRHAYFFL